MTTRSDGRVKPWYAPPLSNHRLLRFVVMFVALVMGYCLGRLAPWYSDPTDIEGQGPGNELRIHSDRYEEAVVTLVDPSRTDPYEFRFVLVVAAGAEFSVIVDREFGKLYVCVGRARTHEISYVNGYPQLRLGECTEVFSGVVLPKRRKK